MASSSHFPLTDLPPEILAAVFSHLTWKDRLNACLVCKDWLQLINRKTLLRDIKVCIRDNVFIDYFMASTRNFVNFSFDGIYFDKCCYQLLKHFSPYIECIDMYICNVNEQLYAMDKVPFNNLAELTLSSSGDWWCLFPALPNLLKLIIGGFCTVSDYGLSRLQKSIKNLKILEIYVKVDCDPDVYMRFYSEGLSYETNPSSEILSLPAIKSFISANVSTLSELKIHGFSASALKELSFVKDLNLTRFDLHYLIGECGDCLINFFKNQKHLKTLCLVDGDLNDSTVDALVIYLPNIECIALWGCPMTDKSLITICKLKQLKILEINDCKSPSPEGINDAISNLSSIQRKHLNYDKYGDGRVQMYFSILHLQ